MSQGFLEQEAQRVKKKKRYVAIYLLFVFVALSVFCYFYKGSIDVNDDTSRRLLGYLIFFDGFVALGLLASIFNAIRIHVRGNDLIIPFKEDSRENVVKLINQEMEDGALVNEYIYEFKEGKKPYGEKIILTHSYLLLCNGMGAVTAIPRNKIYWLCAQPGRKGASSHIVRVLIFTEKKSYYVDGVDVEHVERIADKIYQYMPNIFEGHNIFILSYELEKIYDKNRNKFLEIFEYQKEEYAKNKEA